MCFQIPDYFLSPLPLTIRFRKQATIQQRHVEEDTDSKLQIVDN